MQQSSPAEPTLMSQFGPYEQFCITNSVLGKQKVAMILVMAGVTYIVAGCACTFKQSPTSDTMKKVMLVDMLIISAL